MPTLITAGDASAGLVQTASNDGALTLQTGPAGSKVNAIALASDGTMTLNKPMAGGSLTLATAQNTISGASIDFTGIPSWVKRITVGFQNVSTSGTSAVVIQLGTSGGFQTSSYSSSSIYWNSQLNATNGLLVGGVGATDARNGVVSIATMGSNIWNSQGAISLGNNAFFAAGGVQLANTLDRVRITTVGGTDTFDAGSINILYEG